MDWFSKIKRESNLNFLRVWSPENEKIKQHLFLKQKILMGADKKSDYRLRDQSTPFAARLDFERGELHLLESDKVQAIEPGALFQVGSKVFQWERKPILTKKKSFALVLILLGLCFISIGFRMSDQSGPSCSALQEKIAIGNWSASNARQKDYQFFKKLNTHRKTYLRFLRAHRLLIARAELNSIQSLLFPHQYPKACGVQHALIQYEEKLEEAVSVELLKKNQIVSAAIEVGEFRSKYGQSHLDLLADRIKSRAKKLLWDAWKLEYTNPNQSYELKKKIRKICLALGNEEHCLKNNGPVENRGQ